MVLSWHLDLNFQLYKENEVEEIFFSDWSPMLLPQLKFWKHIVESEPDCDLDWKNSFPAFCLCRLASRDIALSWISKIWVFQKKLWKFILWGLDRDSEWFWSETKILSNRMSVAEEETVGPRLPENDQIKTQNVSYCTLPESNDKEVETLGSFYFRYQKWFYYCSQFIVANTVLKLP